MSKISEQKALEAYPIKHVVLLFSISIQDLNDSYRKPYQEGYEQAMQDFEEWLQDQFHIHPHDCHVVQYESDATLNSIDDLVEQFKEYISSEQINKID